MKKTTLIIFAIALILNACATPPTPTPTATLAPPTQTPLPPTPDLDAILPSEIAEKYTLTTENNETFHLQDKDGNSIPEISIDIDGNFFFGEENTPANLEIENEELLITQGDKTLFFNGEEWVDFIDNLPEDLPEGYIFTNPNENSENLIGAKITDAQGTPLFAYFQGDEAEEEEWIKDFPRVPEITNYADNPLTLEDFESGEHYYWLESLLPDILETVDWDNMKEGVTLGYSGDFLCYTSKNTPHWDDPNEVPPFLRDTSTFGLLTTPNGNRYISLPLLELDKETKTGVWIEVFYALQNSYGPFSDDSIEKLIGFWKSQKVTLIGRTPNLPGIPSSYEAEIDPFIVTTFENNPDMKEIFSEIFNGDPDDPTDHGDFSLLSGLGKYFLTDFYPDPTNRQQ